MNLVGDNRSYIWDFQKVWSGIYFMEQIIINKEKNDSVLL
jgi:hypothetical protein